MLIAILTADRREEAHLANQLREIARTSWCRDAGAAFTLLSSCRVDAVVIALDRDHDGAQTRVIEAVRSGFPKVSVIGYGSLSPRMSGPILRAARAGVHALAFRSFDDLGVTIKDAVSMSRTECLASWVMKEVESLVGAPLQPLVKHCITSAGDRLSVSGLASAFGVHRKTIASRLAMAHLPCAGTLITWGRLLAAARLLEDGPSVERVALQLDYPSASVFRNTLGRYTGLRPREVQSAGGAAGLIPLFKWALLSPRVFACAASRPAR